MTNPDPLHDANIAPLGRPQSQRSRTWGMLVAIAVAALGWGMLLGVSLVPKEEPFLPVAAVVESSPPTVSPAEEASTEVEAANESLDPFKKIERADVLLQYGSIQDALSIYSECLSLFDREQRGWLTVRIAMAHELIGDSTRAVAWYERLARETTDVRTHFLAETSKARVLLNRKEYRASQLVLNGLDQSTILRSLNDAQRDILRHLLAQSYAAQVVAPLQAADYIGTPDIRIQTRSLLENLQPPRQSLDSQIPDSPPNHENSPSAVAMNSGTTRDMAPAPPDHLDVIVQMGHHVEQTYISCYFPAVRLDDAIARFVQLSGQQLKVSRSARERLAVRLQAVGFENTSVAAALDSLLDRIDVCWVVDQGEVAIQTYDELDPAAELAARRSLAERSITRALVQSPECPLAEGTRFLQASLEVAKGDLATARSLFESLVQESVASEGQAIYWLDLATILLRLRAYDQSAAAYYRVVDRTRDPQIQATSYLRVGQLDLDLGRYEESLRPLIRAVTLATDEATLSHAAVSLATAYLLLNNPHASHIALTEARDAITNGNWRHYGGLLEAICLARLDRASNGNTQVHRTTFESTVRAEVHAVPVGVGWLLLADALQSLGLEMEAARLLEEARAQVTTEHVRDLLEDRLLQTYYRIGSTRLAEQILEPSITASDPRRVNRGRLTWARFLLQDERFFEALDVCRLVLELQPTDEEKVQALEYMGRAYQGQREFAQAALCFAGLLPPKVGAKKP